MATLPAPSAPSEPAQPAETPEALQARLARRSRLLGWLAYTLARLLYRTIRLQTVNLEGLTPHGKGAIMVTWHGRTLIPANLLRNRNYWALISLSRDGEIQNNIFRRFGFQTVRGSTGRGGIRGALQMARKVKEGGVLAFTPDGPRGPTHKVQLGVILMAQKSGAPIIPVGISAGPRWLMKSWDRYLIPKPFARAFFIVGAPIYVGEDLDEAGREAIAVEVEVAINRLERDAEARAGFPDWPAGWRTE